MTDLSNTLFQYFTKENVEHNLSITLTDEQWESFRDTVQDDFGHGCMGLVEDLWSDYEPEEA